MEENISLAKEYIQRMTQNLRGLGYTDYFCDLWMQLHSDLSEPLDRAHFNKLENQILDYMGVGDHRPVANPLAKVWFASFYRDEDDDGLVLASKEGRDLERIAGWPTAVIADSVARKVLRERMMFGIASTLGQPQSFVHTNETKKHVQLSAVIFGKGGYGDLTVIDHAAKKIHLVSDLARDVLPVLALRALVADEASPEFGYHVVWHLAVFPKRFPYVLLDDPWAFVNCLRKRPDRVWLVGKGVKFNEQANLAVRDVRHVLLSAISHVEDFYRTQIGKGTDDDYRAWITLATAAETNLLKSEPDFSGLSRGLVDAIKAARHVLQEQGCGNAVVMDHKRFCSAAEFMTEEDRAFQSLPFRNDLSILPDGLREDEEVRYADAMLQRSTQAVKATGKPRRI